MDDSQKNNPLISGDANAISELNNTVGSHNTYSDDHHSEVHHTETHESVVNSVANTDSHDVVSNHITYVLNGQAAKDLTLKDKKSAYRKLCVDAFASGILSSSARKRLDDAAWELELPEAEKKEIEDAVRNQSSFSLSPIDRNNLEMIVSKVESNDTRVFSLLPKLEAIADSGDENVQYYLNLLLACSRPNDLISRYEKRTADSYWQTFWVSFAYARSGVQLSSEKTLRSLSQWSSEPLDNLSLLQAMFCLASRDKDSARQYMQHFIQGSSLLDALSEAVFSLLENDGWFLSGVSRQDFYSSQLFGARPAPATRQQSPSQPTESSAVASLSSEKKKKSGPVVIISVAAAAIILATVLFWPSSPKPATVENPQQQLTSSPEMSAPLVEEAKPAAEKKVEKIAEPTVKKAGQQTKTVVEPEPDTPETWKKQAASGNKDAAFKYGMACYEGNGIEKDYAQAMTFLLPLAEAGYVAAYFPVAEMYHAGMGVAKDNDTAAKWYQKAAAAGNQKAKKILMNM